MFVDKVTVTLQAGKGGNGIVAWRREKFIPKGGPSGGNGGDGGSIILKACVQIPSLEGQRHKRHVFAENGQAGGGNRRHGRTGRDMNIKVPVGTLVKDVQTGDILHDLVEDGQEVRVCEGGRGGRGNATFKTPTNRAPTQCTLGKPGQSLQIELELKLIADVGLVGYPNAGKSTLIQEAAHLPVKIAPYPFTTLRPNLGYLQVDASQRILIADIPGIIEGAHKNRGLGLEFLRHIERTQVLVFVIDASGLEGRSPIDDMTVLRNELSTYKKGLLDKPCLVVLNKMDVEESKENACAFRKKFKKMEILEISAKENIGIDAFIDVLKRLIPAAPIEPAHSPALPEEQLSRSAAC